MKKSENDFHKKRLKRLSGAMKESGCDALIIEAPVDLYYLTGLRLSKGILVAKEGGCRLFVDGRYKLVCAKNGVVSVGDIGDAGDFLKGCKKVGFDAGRTSYEQYEGWKKKYSLVPVSLETFRLIKDENELKALRKSLAILKKGFTYIEKKLKPGVTEREIALELEIYCRKLGAQKNSFDFIVAFGKGSAMPHYKTANVKLKANDTVLLDAGVMWGDYCSDRTRTFTVGKAPKLYKEIQAINIRAQKEAIKACKPGVTIAHVNAAANRVMVEAGYRDKFIHSLGHGIGLEVHEFPYFGKKEVQEVVLQEGMVITIEPGIYIEGFGGVRHEDMILITKDGCKIL